LAETRGTLTTRKRRKKDTTTPALLRVWRDKNDKEKKITTYKNLFG